MGPSRRELLAVAAGATLAGCGGGTGGLSATPPTAAFEVSADGPHAVVLQYTGIGTQDPTLFRVVLEGGGAADGSYGLADVTGDDGWTDEDRYVLDRSTLGLAEPLTVDGLTVTLQYRDDGAWLTLVRVRLDV